MIPRGITLAFVTGIMEIVSGAFEASFRGGISTGRFGGLEQQTKYREEHVDSARWKAKEEEEVMIRTLLVEDHEITRLGLRQMLEQVGNIEVVAEATDGSSAVSKALELQPDLVLMDLGLPILDGIEATKTIKSSITSKVIVITSHEDGEDVLAALSAGADAYCLKGVSAPQLSYAINSVMSSALWLDPGIARHVVKSIGKPTSTVTERVTSTVNQSNAFGLSDREMDVLRLLVDGSSNQGIAEALYLSTETVKTHMRHIMEKLRVSDRTQAAVKAITQGLVSPGRIS